MEQQHAKVIKLLWTGGWDSTFRLLQLLLVHNRMVQPYYIIDSDRLSTGIEIRTMKKIKRQLFEKHVKTRNLLLPTIFKELFDILLNQEVTARFERILKHNFMGSQYEWLARFCSEANIEEIELSIHIDDQAHKILESFVIQADTEKDRCYKLNKIFRGSDEYELFRFFSFPIFNLTKPDIQNIARNEGFEDIMSLTWFCHKPRANSRPCGVCNPCIYTIEEGLGSRIPFLSRIRYYLRIRSRVRRLLMKYPELHDLHRRAKARIILV